MSGFNFGSQEALKELGVVAKTSGAPPPPPSVETPAEERGSLGFEDEATEHLRVVEHAFGDVAEGGSQEPPAAIDLQESALDAEESHERESIYWEDGEVPEVPATLLAWWEQEKLEQESFDATVEASVNRDLEPERTHFSEDKRKRWALLERKLGGQITVEPWGAFHERVSSLPPMRWLVDGLIPEEATVLTHGRPRSMKSLGTLDRYVSCAVGAPVYGYFSVSEPVRAVYVTEEDHPRTINDRIALLSARMVPAQRKLLRENLIIIARQGLSLDNPEHRDFLTMTIEKHRVRAISLEPMRSLTANAEKTAAEFKPIRDWFNVIQNNTTCKLIDIGHHHRKPGKNRMDAAPDADKVSGGALFSSSECLLGFTKGDWNVTTVTPSDFKMSSSPRAFVLSYDSDVVEKAGQNFFSNWISSKAAPIDPAKSEVSLAKSILTRLRDHGPALRKDLASDVKARSEDVLTALSRLIATRDVRLLGSEEAKSLGRKSTAKVYALQEWQRQ